MSDEEEDEPIKAIQPAGRSASSSQNDSYLDYNLVYESDPLDIQVMDDETNGNAKVEGKDLSDKSTYQGNDDDPMIGQVINEATRVTIERLGLETIKRLGVETLGSIQQAGENASSNQSKGHLQYKREPLKCKDDLLDLQAMSNLVH